MSIIKAYYVARGGDSAGVSYDSENFEILPAYTGVFSGSVPGVNVDPTNGNKVIFTGAVGGSDVIRVSTDSGVTLNTPGGNWSSAYVGLNAGIGASISWLDLDNIFISGTFGLLKSTDGGLTFNQVSSTAFDVIYGDTISVAKSYFATEYLGVLALSKGNGVADTKLYTTDDGGSTWVQLLSYTPTYVATPVTDLWMSEDGLKILGCTKVGVFRSTDGGSVFTYPLIYSVTNETGYGAKLSNPSSTIHYVSGGAGSIYKTINGGITWTQQRIGLPSDSIFDLHFYNETSGFVSMGQTLYQTTDSGVNIQSITNIGTSIVQMVSIEYNCGECPPGFTKSAADVCSGVDIGEDKCGPGFAYIEEINACVGQGDCPPVDLYFVIDLSSSVSALEVGNTKDLLRAIIVYEDLLADPPISIPGLLNDDRLRIGIVSYGQNSPGNNGSTTNLNFNLTSDAITLDANIDTLQNLPSAGTNTPLGLWEARMRLVGGTDPNARPKLTVDPENGAIKKIILITDGIPSGVDNIDPTPPYDAQTWYYDTLGDSTLTTYTIENTENGGDPIVATRAGVTDGNCIRTGNPTTGASTSYSDCARCSIFARTMEIGNFIKTVDDINLNVSILANVTGGKNWQTDAGLAPYNFPGPSFEAVITYKALIEGRVKNLSDMFPPSIDPDSDYYVSDGYQPTNPKYNGNMNNFGLTNQQPGSIKGIPYARLYYNPDVSNSNYSIFSNDSSGTWPNINNISAVSGAYGTGATYIGFQSSGSQFNPLGGWDCPLADPMYVPLCSKKSDGSNDLYVALFDEAANSIAPDLAIGLCDASIPVSCPEECTLVKTVENARCECPKSLSISPCVYYIYLCQDLSTPIFCTTNDLSLDVGNVVSISLNDNPLVGCYKIGFSDKDYCEDYSDITVNETYLSCEECNPPTYKLTSCSSSQVALYTQVDLSEQVGKVISLEEYKGLCWTVSLSEDAPENMVLVTLAGSYSDCDCCFQYQCN